MDDRTRNLMFSKESDEYETPRDVYEALDSVLHFTCDPAASHLSHMHNSYWTIRDDGLKQDWTNHRMFLNPPYSTALQRAFVDKATVSWLNGESETVLLIPPRTDTQVWHNSIFPHAKSVFFVQGRLKFLNKVKNSDVNNSAPFPSSFVFMLHDDILISRAVDNLETVIGGKLVWLR